MHFCKLSRKKEIILIFPFYPHPEGGFAIKSIDGVLCPERRGGLGGGEIAHVP